MLWLCTHLPALPLEALGVTPDTVAGIVETRGAKRELTRVTEAARRRGVHPGLPVPAALMLTPEIRLLDRNLEAERDALEAVACWAYQWGAPVTYSTSLSCVWVEVRRSLRMFGGWRMFRVEVERDANVLSYERRHAVAPTQAAAALLARAGVGLNKPVGQVSQLHATLLNKPLSLLPFGEQARDVLYGCGLRTMGDVLNRPREELSRRFGPAMAQWLDQLVGSAPEVWDSFEPPTRYRRRFELAGTVTSSEALLFPLRAMIGDVSQYLRARDVAVQQFRLIFVDGRREHVTLDIGLLAPTRDPVRLMLVLRERLDKLALTEGVQEIILEAERFEEAGAVQEDMFSNSGRRQEDFDTLIERMTARLGVDAVHQIAVTADHRPEKAWTIGDRSTSTLHPSRPPWLLKEPETVNDLTLLGPPERIECGWWQGQAVRRDYFVAEDRRGRRLWAYREAEAGPWQVHGFWQ